MSVVVVPPIGSSYLGLISQEHFPNEFTSGDGKKGMSHEPWWLQLRSGPSSPLLCLLPPVRICHIDHVLCAWHLGGGANSSLLYCLQCGNQAVTGVWIDSPGLEEWVGLHPFPGLV